jgi:hypothetical protein
MQDQHAEINKQRSTSRDQQATPSFVIPTREQSEQGGICFWTSWKGTASAAAQGQEMWKGAASAAAQGQEMWKGTPSAVAQGKKCGRARL